MNSFKHLFGPVPSRRFGRSLGVDLTPGRSCSFNCVFCQVGRTADLTVQRREYVPTRNVLDELETWLQGGGEADVISLAGSGEPTLHSGFGEVLRFARDQSPFRTALLSNGTTFSMQDVREDACAADVVKLSLSAWDQASFEEINRPHPKLSLGEIIDGYIAFREIYEGEIWLEVFLVPGINSSEPDVRRIAGIAKAISPARIHLNSSVRPPAEGAVTPVSEQKLRRLCGLFTPTAEVIPEFRGRHGGTVCISEDEVLAVLKRRPCTVRQIAASLGSQPAEISEHIGNLAREGRVRSEMRGQEMYYLA